MGPEEANWGIMNPAMKSRAMMNPLALECGSGLYKAVTPGRVLLSVEHGRCS
jgi:hypothetical protein